MKEYEEFEILTANLIEKLVRNELLADTTFHRLKKYKGKSGGEHAIDFSYEFTIGNAKYLTIVECKHWKEYVGRDIVMQLKATLDEIGAHKGIVVSASGFQRGAMEFALKNGIGLYKISDGRIDVMLNWDGISDESMVQFLMEVNETPSTVIKDSRGFIFSDIDLYKYTSERFGSEIADLIIKRDYIEINQLTQPQKEIIISQIRQLGSISQFVNEYMLFETAGFALNFLNDKKIRVINAKIFAYQLEAGIISRDDIGAD